MRIEDYAMLGNFRSAALVSLEGSIDWLCLPSFDSPACFAALVGTPENGRWQIRPKEYLVNSRRYREGTLVLDTDFETATGAVRITDCMLNDHEPHTLVRLVHGLRGRVEMTMDLVIRFDYGSIVPWVTKNPFGGLKAVAGPDALRLRTTVPLVGHNFHTQSEFEVAEGEIIPFVLTWTKAHYETPAEVEDPIEAVERCVAFWREWIAQCTYEGPYKEAVDRSLITLKALIYAPTGGMVAAPTTSLPEDLGGIRNWDYRFCWVRDSTFMLYSLLMAGFRDEARDWENWLLRAVAGTPSQLNLMYGLRGERRLTEVTLPWLEGYEKSVPVRIGNAAYSQSQLDVFGELLDSFHVGRMAGLDGGGSWRVEAKLIEYVETAWKEPDHGIWEVRGGSQHFVHSKVMAWVAVDRAVKAVERFGLDGPVERWKALAEEIRDEVCEKGFDRDLGSFVQSYESRVLDASLLMLPLVGFLPIEDERIAGTIRTIRKGLTRDGFVLRYAPEETEDGLTGGEGAFLACTLWMADCLILQGNIDQATEIFERVLGIRNDVGLLSEEYHWGLCRLVGNFPQAFSHVGLINTALNLASASKTGTLHRLPRAQ